MKVCVLSSGSFERNYSSYHLLRDIIIHLQKRGCEVSLIQKYYETQGVFPTELDIKKICIHEVKCVQARKTIFVGRLASEFKYYLQARRYIREEKNSDVFFLQSNNVPYLPIWLIHRITKKPVVYNVQDIFPQNAFLSGVVGKNSVLGKILMNLQKWTLKHSEGIITISEDMKDTLVEAEADESKVTIAYNWANELQGEPIVKRSDALFHVVYAGNIGMMQNVECVVKAACLLQTERDIHFDIYGNGARRERCERLAEGLENVTFYDPVPADRAFSLYFNADVNVVPLAKGLIKTALPSKIAVCLLCKKPVVFCIDKESHFALQMERDIQGSIVSPTDEKELAQAILKIKNGECVQRIPGKTLNQFDRTANLDKYYEALATVCRN